MGDTPKPVGVRGAKNRFSELASQVNASGHALVVLRNNRPWVTIQPADAVCAERRARLARLRALTDAIDQGIATEPEWNPPLSDRDLLGEERMSRLG